ncbi:MAG: YciI family protein [Alphaproteobacteria bacterium]
MFFFIRCNDKPDIGDLRAETREAHLDYLRGASDKVLAAGPTLGDDGETVTGSVLIIKAADRAEAQAFTDNDPYAEAGVFERVTIAPWRKVFFSDIDD